MKRRKGKALMGLAAVMTVSALASGCELFGDLLEEPVIVPVDNDPMPPISGGTLTVTRDGQRAVVADSEADKIFVVDLATRQLVQEFQLAPFAEPGRVEQGTDERVHVVLRGSGKLLTLSLSDGSTAERYACPEPRGVGYDPATERVHVACAGGELVTFHDDPAAVVPLNVQFIERDLRDIAIYEDMIYLTRFTSAEVLVIDHNGAPIKRFMPNSYELQNGNFDAGVAWRARPTADGLLAVVHQAALSDELPTGPASNGTPVYYGGVGTCAPGVVTAATTIYDMRIGVSLTLEGQGNLSDPVLPVDIAVSADQQIAVAAAGSDSVSLTTLGAAITSNPNPCSGTGGSTVEVEAPVAVAFDLSGRLLVQSRTQGLVFVEPDVGVVSTLELPKPKIANTGHAIFHRRPTIQTSRIACASCHPEGREDGHVWNFENIGPRRTQSMLGGVLHTAPLHWDGDMHSIETLVDEVFVNRMAGPELADGEVDVLALWMNNLPALRPSPTADQAAIDRGRTLFYDAEVGCGSCHAGERLTDDRSADVGTGKAFQVPSLINVSYRTPLMHDGCAETVADRFGPCGGGDAHGKTSHLAPWQITDLVAFLESL